jgi:diguanylate cyclase (GGDEF)-like protein
LYDRLNQMLAYAKRHGKMFALLFLDLDGFKAVNDRFGHDIGDQLLREVAGRLGAAIRSEDTLARVGGDEFIFLLSAIHAREDAAIVSDKILALLREDFVINGSVCKIGGSIGVAIFPDHSETMDALVSCADDAMYQAKAKGKNAFQFFQPA